MGENHSLGDYSAGNKELILFDGVCNLCNGAVKIVLRRDRKERFVFAPLQSEVAGQVLTALQRSPTYFSSIIVVTQEGDLKTKSDAALHIAKHLSGGWKALYFLRIIPRSIRDGVYDFIARHRYRFFGRNDHCYIPTPEIQRRFLGAKGKGHGA